MRGVKSTLDVIRVEWVVYMTAKYAVKFYRLRRVPDTGVIGVFFKTLQFKNANIVNFASAVP